MRASNITNRLKAFASGSATGARNWFSIKAATAVNPVEICIYDQIGKDWWSDDGVEAKGFIEELGKISAGTPIILRLNSPGGSVHEGLAIYNRLAERRNDISVIVDGVAASIASVIACCGKSLTMPKNAMLMIHDPWAFVQGNADQLRKAADMLDTHRDGLISVYEKQTGKTKDELKSLMSAETWFNGEQAKENKFATHVTDMAIDFQACAKFNLERFTKAPAELKASADHKPNTIMKKRKEIIAALIALGYVAFNQADDVKAAAPEKHYCEDDSTAELRALLTKAEKGEKPEPKAKAADASSDSSCDPAMADKGADKSKAARQDLNPASFAAMEANLAAINKRFDDERELRIKNEVQAHVIADRISGVQAAEWVEMALKNEKALTLLAALPARPPGAPPVFAGIASESPQDVAKGVISLRAPLASILRGNDCDKNMLATIGANAKQMSALIASHRKQLDVLMVTNTIDDNLKRNVILNDVMRAFARRLIVCSIFSHNYGNVPLQGTNKMEVPYYELDTQGARNWDATNGYIFDQNSSTGSREVEVKWRKYKPFEYTSTDLSRQPYFNPSELLMQKGEQLAVDIWVHVLSLITQANYGNPVHNAEPGLFDIDDIAKIRGEAQKKDWPEIGRSLALSTDHETAILTDSDLKNAQASGSTGALREGSSGRLFGFDMYYSPRIPTNGMNLAGFACMPMAALFASAPIMPGPGVRNALFAFDLATDPATGITLVHKHWGTAQGDKDREIIEAAYGFGKGNGDALLTIANGANVASSSSSSSTAAGVTSSSSSSSVP